MYILNEQQFLNVIGLGKSIAFVYAAFCQSIEGLNILPCTELLDYFTLAVAPVGR